MSVYSYFILNMPFSFIIHVKGASDCYQIVASAAISHRGYDCHYLISSFMPSTIITTQWHLAIPYDSGIELIIIIEGKKCLFVFPHKYIRNGLNHRRINKWPTNVNIDFFLDGDFTTFALVRLDWEDAECCDMGIGGCNTIRHHPSN